MKSVSWPDVLFVPFLHGIFRSDGLLSLAFLVLASATLSGAHSVIIALAQELVASRTSTASHFVSPFARGAPHPQSDSQTGERIVTYLSTRAYLYVAEQIVGLAKQNEGWLRQTAKGRGRRADQDRSGEAGQGQNRRSKRFARASRWDHGASVPPATVAGMRVQAVVPRVRGSAAGGPGVAPPRGAGRSGRMRGAFSGVQSTNYWSSTTNADNPDNTNLVWPVRGGA